jgi:hypothetical protein
MGVIPSGHRRGQDGSLPVGSVQPTCHTVPTYAPRVGMQRPVSRQSSAGKGDEEEEVLRAQQPLCLAVVLQGA